MARVAFIVDQMFEDSELRIPYDRVRQAGHRAVIVGRKQGDLLRGKQGQETFYVEAEPAAFTADDFDALVIPGGYSPDHLRLSQPMVHFTREMFLADKPVAAICHAGWMLVEADVAEGRTLTSWPSIKTDLLNAGGRWVDREVVEDGNLITSRSPSDLPAFCTALLRQLEHGPGPRLEAPLAPEAASSERPESIH
jgi:protease I